MNNSSLANRYVNGLFNVISDSQDESIARELCDIIDALLSNSNQWIVLKAPLARQQDKKELIMTVVSQYTQHPLVSRFFELLLEKRRLALLPDIHKIATRRLHQSQGIKTALITTAHPVSKAVESNIINQLQDWSGGTLSSTFSQNPQIVGGFKALIDHTLLIDGSVEHSLKQLHSIS